MTHIQARMTTGKWRTINIYETEEAALRHFGALAIPGMYRVRHESELDEHMPAVYFSE